MNNGLCGYSNETILVSTETMKRMCASFEGKPVYVKHQDVNLETLQEDADGYVIKCFYNELDGWLWAEILIVSDSGHEAVEKKWSVSNAYVPTQTAAGGTCHDVVYDREILNGEFTHMAIVDNPRYEDAEIFTPEEFKNYQAEKKNELEELQNSKSKGRKLMFWKKAPVENAEDMQDAMVNLSDGSSVSIKDMIEEMENYKMNQEKEEKEDKEKMNEDMEIEVGDEKMTLKELMNRYEKMNMSKKEEEGRVNQEKEEEERANQEAKDKEEKENEGKMIREEERKNSKYFDALRGAKGDPSVQLHVDTSSARVERGKNRYGSKK